LIQTADKGKSAVIFLQNYAKNNAKRVKNVRPEINNKIVENHAAEITAFKVGYVFGSPITFVQRASVDIDGNDGKNDDKKIAILNEMMFEKGKSEQDQVLGKDISVCGVGYRIVLPKKVKDGVSAFTILRLNPNNTFVVRFNDIFKKVALLYILNTL